MNKQYSINLKKTKNWLGDHDFNQTYRNSSLKDQLNVAFKKTVADSLKKQSHDFNSSINLPPITTNNYKTLVNHFQNNKVTPKKQEKQVKQISIRHESVNSKKIKISQSIFSNQHKIDQASKITRNVLSKKSNRNQLRSRSSKSTSIDELDMKKIKGKNLSKLDYLNVREIPLLRNQGRSKNPECSTDKKQEKKYLINQISAQDILLNSHIYVAESSYLQKLPKQLRKQTKNQNKNLTKVEFGIQIVRVNKLKKAQALIQQANYSQATQILNFLLEINQNDSEVLQLLAELAQKVGKFQLSKQYYKIITKNQTKLTQFGEQVRKVKALQKLSKFDEAMQKLQTIESNFLNLGKKEKIDLLVIKGQLYVKAELFEDGLELFQQALRIRQSQQFSCQVSEIYSSIGEIYFHYQMYKRALFYFRNSLRGNGFNQQKTQHICSRIEFCNQTLQYLKARVHSPDKANFPSGKKNPNDQKSQHFQSFNKNLDVCCSSIAKKLKINEEDQNLTGINQKNQVETEPETNNNILSSQQRNAILEATTLKNKGFYKQALEVLSGKNDSLSSIQERAKLYLKLGDFQKSYQELEKYLAMAGKLCKTVGNKQNSGNTLTLSDKQNQITEDLNLYISKIKELQILSISQSNFDDITQRRNFNIAQAIKLFENFSYRSSVIDSSLEKSLSVIREQSTISITKNQEFIHEDGLRDVFSLKQIRQVLKIWKQKQFSIESLNDIAEITYSLVRNDKSDFALLPFHIVVYTMNMKKLQIPFAQINQNINDKINQLCKIYPPSAVSITQSQLKRFQIDWKNKQKIDLFAKVSGLDNFQKIYKKIEELSNLAAEQKYLMDNKCQQICEQYKGFNYKSNLKLPTEPKSKQENNSKHQRSYCRIIEKILAKDLQKKKEKFLSSINLQQIDIIKNLFLKLNTKWEETINDILQVKNKKSEHIPFYVYDLMRAKCMFSNVRSIDAATEAFIQGDKSGDFKIVEIENRLSNKTRDVVLKIRFKFIVAEIQLALEFQSVKNDFNHGLYELSRSPFGPFFASFMWFTAFSSVQQNNQLIVNQKLKWKMKRLNHLKKFIYEQKILIRFSQQPHSDLLMNQFKCNYLILEDFVVRSNSIEGVLMTPTGLFVEVDVYSTIDQSFKIIVKSVNQSSFSIPSASVESRRMSLVLSQSKPAYRFKFILHNTNKSFASVQNSSLMNINLEGTTYFWALNRNQQQSEFFLIEKDLDIEIDKSTNLLQSNKTVFSLWKSEFQIAFEGENLSKKTNQRGILNSNHNEDYLNQIDQAQKLQKEINQTLKTLFYSN